VKTSNLKTLLTEPQAVGNPFSALAKDLNVKVSDFDPMETAGADGLKPDHYVAVMRQNVANLTTAFGRQSTQSFLLTPVSKVAVVPQTVGFRL
ncbi:MAG: metal ABC transporter solute-binding protein, Zn/Mn family, partial [Leptodesmis sp.]